MIFDIVVLAVVLLAALIGLWKGFFKTLISFFGWFMSFLAAFFLTKVVAEALLDVSGIRQFVLGTEGWSFFTWIYGKLPDFENAGGVLAVVLKPLISIAAEGGGDMKISLAALLANGLFNIIVCIALLIVIRLILLLFTMFANAMTQNKLVGALNRLLGLLMGAVRGIAFVVVAMAIMSFIMGFSFMAPVRTQLDNSVISRRIFEPVNNVTHKVLSGNNDTLDKLLQYLGYKQPEVENPDVYEQIAGDYRHIASEGGRQKEYKYSLKADRSFTRNFDGEIKTGTFTVEGKTLTFTYDVPKVEPDPEETNKPDAGEEPIEGETPGEGEAETPTEPKPQPEQPKAEVEVAELGDGYFYIAARETHYTKDEKYASVLGEYTGKSGDAEYIITLKPDHVYTMSVGGSITNGTFTLDGDNIILNDGNGSEDEGKIGVGWIYMWEEMYLCKPGVNPPQKPGDGGENGNDPGDDNGDGGENGNDPGDDNGDGGENGNDPGDDNGGGENGNDPGDDNGGGGENGNDPGDDNGEE